MTEPKRFFTLVNTGKGGCAEVLLQYERDKRRLLRRDHML